MICLGADPAPNGNMLAVSGLKRGPVTGWFAGVKGNAVLIGDAWIDAKHLDAAIIEWPVSYGIPQSGTHWMLDCRSNATVLGHLLQELGVKVYCVPSQPIRNQVCRWHPTAKRCKGWKADAWIKEWLTLAPPFGHGVDCKPHGMLSSTHQRDAYLASLFPFWNVCNEKYLQVPNFTHVQVP